MSDKIGQIFSRPLRLCRTKRLSIVLREGRVRERGNDAKQTEKVFSPFTSHLSLKRAFTLAEILITLGIIGVVAALTIPPLISSYKKNITLARFKKAFSTLSQATQLSQIENVDKWDYSLSAEEFFNTYLKNHIKSYENLPLSEIRKRVKYKYPNGQDVRGTIGNNNSYAAKLSDGTFVIVDEYTDGTCRNIIFDINGFQKPNQIGNDVFYCQITPYGFVPYNAEGRAFESCNKYETGYGCSKKIIDDGWRIAEDYPIKF